VKALSFFFRKEVFKMNKENILLNLESAEEKLKTVFLNSKDQKLKRRTKHVLDKVTNLKAGVREDIFKEE
jgi:hypothetical protein